jgi:hypothetical protein
VWSDFGLLFLAAFWILVPIAIWIYALVFAFSALWFAHFCLAALEQVRAQTMPSAADPQVPFAPGADDSDGAASVVSLKSVCSRLDLVSCTKTILFQNCTILVQVNSPRWCNCAACSGSATMRVCLVQFADAALVSAYVLCRMSIHQGLVSVRRCCCEAPRSSWHANLLDTIHSLFDQPKLAEI